MSGINKTPNLKNKLMSKILITGGAGFIGYHLATRLEKQGLEIVIVDNFSRNKKDEELKFLFSKPNVNVVDIDLTDSSSLTAIGTGYDYVYHLAGINGIKSFFSIPHEVLRVGVMTTLNILDWFKDINNKPEAKILFTSSNEVYTGIYDIIDKPLLPTPENAPSVITNTYDPRWSYGGNKLIGELFFINYSRAYDFRMVIVRPHNVYGPRAGYEPMIPRIIDKIIKHSDPFSILGPEEQRSFCYVDDMVTAMQMSIESPNTDSGTYNIGNPYETKIMDIVEILFDIENWHPRKLDIKNSLEGSVAHSLPDVSKIKKDAGWESQISMKDGLKRTIDWYKK